MKIPAIKKAVEQFTTAQLQEAEQALYEEQMPLIDIEGDDEGEKLTHVLAALEIKENMAKGMEFKEALRAYTQRVRNSIS
jgi:hypothetical protein